VERVTATNVSPEDPEAEVVVYKVVEPPVSVQHRVVTGSILVVVGIVCALLLGLSMSAGSTATFQLSAADAKVQVPNLVVPARVSAILLGLVVMTLGVWQIARGFSKRSMKWVIAVALLCFVLTFLCWAATGQQGTVIDLLGLLQQTIFLAVPLILGALAGVLCERSGVINVAIEGQMLAGGWAGAVLATLAHN